MPSFEFDSFGRTGPDESSIEELMARLEQSTPRASLDSLLGALRRVSEVHDQRVEAELQQMIQERPDGKA